MAKVSPVQNIFNVGEASPLLYGRTDFDKYRGMLATCLNGIPLIQGPYTRRPGTHYVAEVKDSTKKTRLVRFEFSTTQAYILEFGDLYFRVYRDHGQVVDGASAVEVTTPYTEDEIFALKFTQSADVLYVAHPSHGPRKISRTSHTAWTITAIAFQDGPYLPANNSSTTLSCSATSGSVTVTASAVAGINGGDGFQSTDVGRVVRIKTSGTDWGWGKITAVGTTTSCTVSLETAVGATTATSNWRLGMYSDTTGHPGAVGFYQDRLTWAGSTGSPQSLQFSVVGDYENHSPSDPDGTVADDHAVNITLNSGDVQVIRWVLPDEKGLLVGTVSAEWLVGPSTNTASFSATNIKADETSRRGSADIQAVRPGKAALFVQRAGRKLRELAYVYADDGFNAPDMTVLAEHITKGGIVDIAYQQEPYSILWAVRADGVLLGFTYDRDQNVIGWARHVLGGVGDSDGGAPVVESVACIPEPNGTYDEVWMVVKRYIGGATVRCIEYMAKPWERGDDGEDAFFCDCGLTYDGTAATTISGLDHVIGETVGVLADGAAHAEKVVDENGEIALDVSASVVQVGYRYKSDGKTLRNDAGAADGTAQGKIQRTHAVTFRFHDTLGVQVGPDFDNLTPIIFRTMGDDLGVAVPLFSGDEKVQPWEGGYTTENLICFRFDDMFPGTLLAIMPQQVTQDG